MKALAFVIGLFIAAVGASGIIVPAFLVWIAAHSATSSTLYIIATVRVAFGLILISVASVSRTPKTLRVFGYLFLITGMTTALMGFVAIELAHALIEWWLQAASGVVRLAGIPIMAFGCLITYSCTPTRYLAELGKRKRRTS